MNEWLVVALGLLNLLLLGWLVLQLRSMLAKQMEDKHRAMLLDMHDGLSKLGDRLNSVSQESAERLRVSVSQELQATRDAMNNLKLAQTENLSQNREALLEKLNLTFEALNKTVESRLDLISGKVTERLDEGFKKTNETFANVMARLATIDEAQKKIDGLTTNMVSLQELLGDKRSRGAFGEVQLEGLVRNLLPESAFEFQYTFSNKTRVDCVLKLPEPTGLVAVDSKFPLENYEGMFFEGAERVSSTVFKTGVKRHVDDIASKYIIPNETSDGAVMFIPAEAVFAEIHAHHRDVVDYAQAKRVWIVSPTTLMAVLNTARAVLKDTETRKQVHIIQDELGKLGKDFSLFDARMKKLADHIRLAHEDAEKVQITSHKITRRFAQIERVELEGMSQTPLLEEGPDEAESE
ncbi:MAG TPA: DNA recombination protein RmuC [Methylophilaceae bacterium]|jgi:DNA recombination protein RmuC